MGCDIHIFSEEKQVINGVEQWFNTDNWRLNPYYDDKDESEPMHSVVDMCGDRDYSMFTALCGVRDYSEESPKISVPKGLPDDCCSQIKKESDRWDGDGHSHSYATLREVKNFVEKNEPIKFSGLITEDQAKELDKGALPTSWCQGSSRPMVRRVWEDNTRQPLGDLLEEMYERFRPYWKPENIENECLDNFRVVFWFDN